VLALRPQRVQRRTDHCPKRTPRIEPTATEGPLRERAPPPHCVGEGTLPEQRLCEARGTRRRHGQVSGSRATLKRAPVAVAPWRDGEFNQKSIHSKETKSRIALLFNFLSSSIALSRPLFINMNNTTQPRTAFKGIFWHWSPQPLGTCGYSAGPAPHSNGGFFQGRGSRCPS